MSDSELSADTINQLRIQNKQLTELLASTRLNCQSQSEQMNILQNQFYIERANLEAQLNEEISRQIQQNLVIEDLRKEHANLTEIKENHRQELLKYQNQIVSLEKRNSLHLSSVEEIKYQFEVFYSYIYLNFQVELKEKSNIIQSLEDRIQKLEIHLRDKDKLLLTLEDLPDKVDQLTLQRDQLEAKSNKVIILY